MIQKVSSSLISSNNTSFKGRKNSSIPYAFERDVDRSLIMRDLTALGLLTIGVIGYVKHKNKVNMQNIKQIKFINQAIANQAVYSTTARDIHVLNNYSKHIADKKASVLRYKLDNGLFIGKSPKAMKHIKSNLKKFELQAI